MKGGEPQDTMGNYGENYAFSDGLEVNDVVSKALQFLELDCLDLPLVTFPLIDPTDYQVCLYSLLHIVVLEISNPVHVYTISIICVGIDH